MSVESTPSETADSNGLSASVQVLNLSEGVYFCSVRAASPIPVASAGNLMLPAVYIGSGPGVSNGTIGFMPGPRTHGNWLCGSGDGLIVNVSDGSTGLVIISLRAPGREKLAIDIERLENRREIAAEQTTGQLSASGSPREEAPQIDPLKEPRLRLQVVAHIRNRGDVTFSESKWAGRAGRGFSIEAFSVTPLESLTVADIEYKALTTTGIETPWVGNGASCGTRGLGVPLVGFAIRLKNEANKHFECEYSGYFQSRITIGPLRHGQPCRSTIPNDPLEGILVKLTKREESASEAEALAAPSVSRKGKAAEAAGRDSKPRKTGRKR